MERHATFSVAARSNASVSSPSPSASASHGGTETSAEGKAEVRTLVLATMSFSKSVYHNHEHVEEAARFAKEAIAEVEHNNPGLLSPEMASTLVEAAYLHDVYHPAGGDQKTIHDIAEFVTGRLPGLNSTLEHLHGQIGVALLKRTKTFRSLDLVAQARRVELITQLITFTSMDTYERTMRVSLDLSDPISVAMIIIRCADLCHLTFELPKHLQRVRALNNELHTVITRADNVGFIERFARPHFEALARICRSARAEEWLVAVRFKHRYWSELATDDEQPSDHGGCG